MKLKLVKFQSDEEINVDSDKAVIIGRGSLFGCYDKKVSRTHGQLQLTPDGTVRLTALHSNPCFIMKNGLPPVIPLTKNKEKILNNGDFIGLLPNSFWYKIVLDRNENVNVFGSISNDNKSDSKTKKDCNLEQTTIGNINDSNANNLKENQPDTSKIEIHSPLVPNNDKNVGDKMNLNDSLEERLKALEHTKKLPLYMYEIDDFPVESASKNINEEAPSDVVEVVKEVPKHDIKENKESEIQTTGFKQDQGNWDQAMPISSKDNSQSNDQCDNFNTKDPQKDLKTCKDSVNSSEAVKENVPHTSTGLTVNAPKEIGNSSKSPDCPGSQRRPLCQYEARCYRINNQHKRDFCHPGDPDFVPYENRPMCQHGSSCYRRNKSHLIEYRHPKKKSPATDSPKNKRRKKEVKYRDTTDEDDYDLEDPFINDGSSDEFIPSDSEEELEDSD